MADFTSGNALAFLLSDDSRLYRQAFERAVAKNGYGLTPGEIRTLGHVLRYHGSRQAALAERMVIEPMTLSAYLDRLEARGLIRREVDQSDRRAKIIQPTQAATDVAEKLTPLLQQVYDEATRGIDPQALTECIQILQRIRANLTNDPQLLDEGELFGGSDMTGRPAAE